MVCPKVDLRDLVRTKRQMRELGLHDTAPSRPSPALECRPVLVDTASPDETGRLVLADGRLVAVLVRVAGFQGEAGPGGAAPSGWQMEAGFGPCAAPVPPWFDTLAEAGAWVHARLAAR